jgi:hypothetical protein
MLLQIADSAALIASLATPFYFAPIASLSNSGKPSSQTFKLSIVTSGCVVRYASRKASVLAAAVFAVCGEVP